MSTFLLRAAAGFVAICKANASLVCVYTPIYTYTIFYFNCSIFNGLLIKKKKHVIIIIIHGNESWHIHHGAYMKDKSLSGSEPKALNITRDQNPKFNPNQPDKHTSRQTRKRRYKQSTVYRLARAINQCSTASRFVSSLALMP